MKHLTHLIYCDKHGFALYREAIDYSALPIASCGCFPSKTLNLKEVIEIVGKIRLYNIFWFFGSKKIKTEYQNN